MIAVVILAFGQVIPREIRRIFELYYPVEALNHRLYFERHDTTFEERVNLLYIRYYGYFWMKIFGNIGTLFNHSFTFYLYMVMNRLFREEFLRICRCRLAQPILYIGVPAGNTVWKDWGSAWLLVENFSNDQLVVLVLQYSTILTLHYSNDWRRTYYLYVSIAAYYNILHNTWMQSV